MENGLEESKSEINKARILGEEMLTWTKIATVGIEKYMYTSGFNICSEKKICFKILKVL